MKNVVLDLLRPGGEGTARVAGVHRRDRLRDEDVRLLRGVGAVPGAAPDHDQLAGARSSGTRPGASRRGPRRR